MDSWQSTLKTMLTITSYLLKTGTLSDVTFLVGNGPNKKSFNAHRLLLAIRSDVFERMFFGALSEKRGKIEITDVSPDIFEIMLKFIYEDTLGVKTMEEAIETFAVAHKYNITQLMNLSSNYIKNKLNSKNASLIYQMSSIYDDKDLKSICNHIISENPEEVIQSETFTQISFVTVERMLEIVSLNILNHTVLFESLIKWAKTEFERHKGNESAKSLRQLMDPFLPKIKFLSMSTEEFTRGPATSGILTESEIGKMLMNICIPNSAVLPDWCNKDKNLKQKVIPSLGGPLVQRLILSDESCIQRQSSLPPNDEYGNPRYSRVLCTIEVIGRGILLHGVRIPNFSDPSELILFRINYTEQAIHTRACLPSPVDLGEETKLRNLDLFLKEPYLLIENLKYVIQVVARYMYFNDIIHSVDVPLPSGGQLQIRCIPNPFTHEKFLPFTEIFYSEFVSHIKK